jgi:SAM-dependent methyltransferase
MPNVIMSIDSNPVPTFHESRPSGIHGEAPWSQFRYVASRLRTMISEVGELEKLSPGSRLIDFGCATAPYRDLVGSDIEYVGVDIAGNPAADVEMSLDHTVPLPDASCEMVLSTQVLEHVREPPLYLAECFRLLRPGGRLVLTTHGIMYYHRDPEDYWRWTSDGLAKIVGDAGFEVSTMRGIMGLAATAIQLFQDSTMVHVPRKLRKPYIMFMQEAAMRIDRRYSEVSRLQNSLVLIVCAVRPL